jgi:hypothetical protein
MGELFIAFGILTAIIWIVIGWRAMRAHEKIADCVSKHVDALSRDDSHNLRRENATQHKHYKQYILQNPDAEKLPSKERHEQFRDWLKSRKDLDSEEW